MDFLEAKSIYDQTIKTKFRFSPLEGAKLCNNEKLHNENCPSAEGYAYDLRLEYILEEAARWCECVWESHLSVGGYSRKNLLRSDRSFRSLMNALKERMEVIASLTKEPGSYLESKERMQKMARVVHYFSEHAHFSCFRSLGNEDDESADRIMDWMFELKAEATKLVERYPQECHLEYHLTYSQLNEAEREGKTETQWNNSKVIHAGERVANAGLVDFEESDFQKSLKDEEAIAMLSVLTTERVIINHLLQQKVALELIMRPWMISPLALVTAAQRVGWRQNESMTVDLSEEELHSWFTFSKAHLPTLPLWESGTIDEHLKQALEAGLKTLQAL